MFIDPFILIFIKLLEYKLILVVPQNLGILPAEDIDGDHKQLNNELHCILAYPGSLDLHHFLVSILGTYLQKQHIQNSESCLLT